MVTGGTDLYIPNKLQCHVLVQALYYQKYKCDKPVVKWV